MRHRTITTFALMFVLATGCRLSDEESDMFEDTIADNGVVPADLAGIFEVTHHTESLENCDQEGAAKYDTYFFVVGDSSVGQHNQWATCRGNDREDSQCRSLLGRIRHDEPINAGFRGRRWDVFSRDGDCGVGRSISTITLEAPDVVRIELKDYETTPIPSEHCEDAAEGDYDPKVAELATTCIRHIVLEGERIVEL